MPKCSAHVSRRSHARRSGITLLEVLVAMLVLTVGVLGMAALIPLGKLELADGNMSDSSSTVGRWAFRDLSVRGYLRPEMWADPVTGEPIYGRLDSSTRDRYSLTPTTTARVFMTTSISSGLAMRPPFVPIVIDPLMLSPENFGVTQGSSPVVGDELKNRQLCGAFPYSVSAIGESQGTPEGSGLCPAMPRVTLRTMPPSFTAPDPVIYTMRYDLASSIFRGSDDLAFELPENDVRFRPQQQFATYPEGGFSDTSNTFAPTDGAITLTGGANRLNALRAVTGAQYRKYLGSYSWFYIVEPSFSEAFVPAGGTMHMLPRSSGPYGAPTLAKQYRVWVVVCQQRDLRPLPNPDIALPGEKGMGERMVWVDFLDRGTARLRISGVKTEAGAMRALDVRTNQWFGVLGRYAEPTLQDLPNSKGAEGMRYVMEWYRVTGVAERPQSVGESTWYREVTVAGRDFFGLGFSFFDEDPFTYPDITEQLEPITGWGVIVKGARGVYEKTLYDDNGSLWSM